MQKLLAANRGVIAICIRCAANELGLRTVRIYLRAETFCADNRSRLPLKN